MVGEETTADQAVCLGLGLKSDLKLCVGSVRGGFGNSSDSC